MPAGRSAGRVNRRDTPSLPAARLARRRAAGTLTWLDDWALCVGGRR
ncbi:hypothetical protein MAV_1070 [Mycobacterium avium 104]|uniref:Uncharacterized protein n=1 Tax=Mycobacterium avium (strain 104) TaxID=243243 RepID=A0A0H3A0D1_MYCA1|nr:hypothetical protein MAV_1070 [Mycobacterium avium 104]